MRKVTAVSLLTAFLLCGCGAGVPEPAAGSVPVQAAPVQAVPEDLLTAPSAQAEIWAESVSGYPEAVQVLLAHGMLCRLCTYDQTAEHRHTAYGALIDGGAVCDGYAEAFVLLMQAAGIPAMTVLGSAADAEGQRIAHAWNLVQLGGAWYHIDCTWDDAGDAVQYTYFLCDDAAMMQTHAWQYHKYPAAEGGVFRYETIVQEMQRAVLPADYSSLG